MSFSSDVKKELVEIQVENNCCKKSLLYGMALFSKSFSFREVVFQSKSRATAELYCSLLKELCSIKAVIKASPSGKIYTASVKKAENVARIMSYFAHDKAETSLRINFSNFDCEGVVLAEETYKDLVMTATTKGTLRVFLTDLNCNPVELLKTERELLKERGFSDEELGSWEITVDEKENQDWSKKWKEKWTVTHVTDKIAVVPSWLTYEPKEGEITITLDPGCAFGTGTHQTTQLCMKAIEKYLKKGDKVADIGTGSGILSICAIKFGASSAYGCDIDDTVIDVCRENAKINGIDVDYPQGECNPAPVKFELNTADKITEKFDFVCANILHNVLAEIMGDLKNIMKDDAKMSLSGILDEKKSIVLEAIEREGLKIIDTISQDQWISFVVTK